MDKLKMQTANKADENFKQLAEMFPNAVTETTNENGKVVRAIDKDALMQETYLGKIKMIYIDIKALRLIQFNYSSADFAA